MLINDVKMNESTEMYSGSNFLQFLAYIKTLYTVHNVVYEKNVIPTKIAECDNNTI